MNPRNPHYRALDAVRLPSGLALRLQRRDEQIELRIDGAHVLERPVGRSRRAAFDRRYARPRVAEIVFEHRLARLCSEGFASSARKLPAPDYEPSPLLAPRQLGAQLERSGDPTGTLLAFQTERLVHDGADERALEQEMLASLATSTFGPLPDLGEPLTCIDDGHEGLLAFCYDDDVATIEDEIRPELERIGREALGFDPNDRSVALGVTGLHRLRRVLESPLGTSLRSLRFMLFGPLAPLLQVLDAYGCATVVASLVARGSSPPLGPLLPRLRGLATTERALPGILASPVPSLRHLVIFRGDDELRGSLAPLTREKLTALEHLGLWYRRTSAEGLRALAAHPLLPKLRTLEIWATDAAKSFPFEELFKLRAPLAHLERILLGGHLVPATIRERLAAWPAVELVSHDRREALAFDIAALGWARALR